MLFSQTRVPNFGFVAADPNAKLDPDVMITGSFNLMFRGETELESCAGFGFADYGGVLNTGGDQSQILGRGWATIGDDIGEGSGNVVEFIGNTLWFVGSGLIRVWVPGVTAVPVSLGNSPSNNFLAQVAPLNNAKNGFLSPFIMGLQAQSAPAVLTAGAAGVMNGKHSVQLTWLRDATGAESLPSPPALSVNVTNQKVIIQFPASTNPVFDRDKWRIYATEGGFGDTGPFLLFTEVPERRVSDESGTGYNIETGTFDVFTRNPTVTGYFTSEMIGKRLRFFDGVPTLLHTATITGVTTNTFVVKGVTYGDKVTFTPAYSGNLTSPAHNWNIDAFVSPATRAIEFEWLKNDLLAQQPPVDFFPPNTTAKFIAAIGNVMVLIGTEDGNGIAVSVPNFPEAFPPDFRFRLPEPPVGVLSRPQDGFFYILCENSIHELRFAGFTDGSLPVTGSPTRAPLVPRTVSDLIGAAQQKAATQVGRSLYFFTKSKSPARILPDGTVDDSFGDRVELAMKAWDASKVVVTYDERKNFIMYSHVDTHFMYYPTYNVWTPPMLDDELASNADTDAADMTSGFTLNGVIHVSYYKSESNNTVDTNGTTTITGVFLARDVGKIIIIPGAGTAGGTYTGRIVSVAVDFLSAVVEVAPPTNVTNANATIKGFSMYTFDRDKSNTEYDKGTHFKVRFSFSDYGVGTNPKTVTRVRVGGKLQVLTNHFFDFFRDYNGVVPMGAQRQFQAFGSVPGEEENHIYPIVDCNNGEAQLLSVEFDGTGNRAKIHYIEVSGEVSSIDANFNA